MKRAFFGSLLLLLFTACSPKIGTMATKTYPSLDADFPVVVYLYQTDIPAGTESLGKVTISKNARGLTVNCDSAAVVDFIKKEARKIGGNAVCITDHTGPSFWRGPCHQMKAVILKVKDFEDQSGHLENSSIEEFTRIKNIAIKPVLPKFRIGANIGYGWRNAKLSNEIPADMRDFYKKMKSGMVWDGSFHYYFNDTYGIGLIYSSYHASNSIYTRWQSTGESGKFNLKHTITFIGPVFATRVATNNEKWIFDSDMGLGFLGYCADGSLNRHYSKQKGATVGFRWSMGVEYKFDKHWGVYVGANTIRGILREIDIDENGVKSTYRYKNWKGEGLGQLRMTTGLYFHF